MKRGFARLQATFKARKLTREFRKLRRGVSRLQVGSAWLTAEEWSDVFFVLCAVFLQGLPGPTGVSQEGERSHLHPSYRQNEATTREVQEDAGTPSKDERAGSHEKEGGGRIDEENGRRRG